MKFLATNRQPLRWKQNREGLKVASADGLKVGGRVGNSDGLNLYFKIGSNDEKDVHLHTAKAFQSSTSGLSSGVPPLHE